MKQEYLNNLWSQVGDIRGKAKQSQSALNETTRLRDTLTLWHTYNKFFAFVTVTDIVNLISNIYGIKVTL